MKDRKTERQNRQTETHAHSQIGTKMINIGNCYRSFIDDTQSLNHNGDSDFDSKLSFHHKFAKTIVKDGKRKQIYVLVFALNAWAVAKDTMLL